MPSSLSHPAMLQACWLLTLTSRVALALSLMASSQAHPALCPAHPALCPAHCLVPLQTVMSSQSAAFITVRGFLALRKKEDDHRIREGNQYVSPSQGGVGTFGGRAEGGMKEAPGPVGTPSKPKPDTPPTSADASQTWWQQELCGVAGAGDATEQRLRAQQVQRGSDCCRSSSQKAHLGSRRPASKGCRALCQCPHVQGGQGCPVEGPPVPVMTDMDVVVPGSHTSRQGHQTWGWALSCTVPQLHTEQKWGDCGAGKCSSAWGLGHSQASI